ncbi:MAG: uroporphyrinogen-III synthase [Phyllobacteriaceae bacterium]|nr:uroporphyrinogen-III synthase [Phyllobacteriaceae bacterium]
MKLIITRPSADAVPLAAKLEGLGHRCIILPLLDIIARQDVAVPAKTYQAICLTSANAILHGLALPPLHATAVLCVGPQSAAAATAKGFLNVSAHGGDVAGLSAWITDHLKPKDGPLLYLSGATTSGDLEGRLMRAGFSVDRLITYDAVAASPSDMAQALQVADGVLLYSPRTAMLWREQVEKMSGHQHMSGIMHYCLSPAVAAKLPSDWKQRIAPKPDETAMLALLEPTSFDRT